MYAIIIIIIMIDADRAFKEKKEVPVFYPQSIFTFWRHECLQSKTDVLLK